MTNTDYDPSLTYNQTEVQNLQTRLESAQKILVVYDSLNCNLDQAAMATSLYLTLKARGAQVSILSLGEPVVAHSSLVGINEVVTQLPKEGVIISLDNSSSAISNVSCDADEITQTLKVFVKTSPGQDVIDADQIHILPLLAEFDQIVAVGVPDIPALANIGLTGLTDDRLTMFNNPDLSHSQLLANLLRHWLWPINEDIATNLLMGIDADTQSFAKLELNAEVFEITAWLLRNGGRRYLPEVQERQADQSHFYGQNNSFTFKPAASADKKKVFSYKKRGLNNKNPRPTGNKVEQNKTAADHGHQSNRSNKESSHSPSPTQANPSTTQEKQS